MHTVTQTHSRQRGFTLIEAIIYVALAGGIFASVLAVTFPLFTGSEHLSARITTDTEVAFISRKVTWMLSDVQTVSSPPQAATSSILTTVANDGSTRSLRHSSTTLEFRENGAPFEPLVAGRVDIENFTVFHAPPSAGGEPRYIEIQFDANGEHIGPFRHYLHQ